MENDLSTSCGHGDIFLSQSSTHSSQPSSTHISVNSPPSMATTTTTHFSLSTQIKPTLPKLPIFFPTRIPFSRPTRHGSTGGLRITTCKAAESTVAEVSGDGGKNWVPVVPVSALPKGERRVIIQDGETILLLWYKESVFAIENRSPAEGAYSEGLLNAKLTQDGCVVCPTTDSTFDLRTGEIKEWYPNNPVLRVLTPALRSLFVYPVKTDDQNIYISIGASSQTDASAEIVFSGRAQPGFTSTDVNIEEVRMIVDESAGGFGFTSKNEVINGKAAVIGFLLLLDFELLTGKGLLKGTGFLDFLYAATDAFK